MALHPHCVFGFEGFLFVCLFVLYSDQNEFKYEFCNTVCILVFHSHDTDLKISLYFSIEVHDQDGKYSETSQKLCNMTDFLRPHLLIQMLSIVLCLSWMPDFVSPS